MKAANLSLETAREFYKQGGPAKQFALDNYTEKELTEKVLPKTWEELERVVGFFVTNISDITSNSAIFISDPPDSPETFNRNTFVTVEQAQASIALAQLSQLKHVYCDGWVPDWRKSEEMKYTIYFTKDVMYCDTMMHSHHFLSFPTVKLRDEFLRNFRDLIWQAKPLMS
jgi:hypothetical protein